MLRQPKLVLKVSQVPDWGRRAIRLSLALAFFTSIASTLWIVPGRVVVRWFSPLTRVCRQHYHMHLAPPALHPFLSPHQHHRHQHTSTPAPCTPVEHLRAEWGDEVRQTCNWAGASCAVVAASPLIGKVAQLSYERTLGTLTGGLLGFLVSE